MASCPSCGFDLTSEGSCPVCGGQEKPERSGGRGPARRAALVIGGAMVAFGLAAGAFFAFSAAGEAAKGAEAAVSSGPSVPTIAPQTARQPVSDPPAADPPGGASEAGAAPSNAGLPPLTNEAAYLSWMQSRYPGQEARHVKARWDRAKIALERGHIRHERLLIAFLLTPREWFVRAGNESRAYENAAMPIGYGQTISGPDLVVRMTDYLNLQPHQRVLEIGTGSGYQSALLSQLTDNVYTIEIVKPLAAETDAIYVKHASEVAAYANIHRRAADGYYGWPEHAPFDRIIVTCGIDHIPPELLKELTPGGIMVIPIGPPSGQTILKITKQVAADGQVSLTREDIYHGMAKDIFVPFTADGGKIHSLNTNLTP